MQKRQRKALGLLALLLLGLGVTDGRAQDTLRLTLEDALRIALSESPTIKLADGEIQRLEYSKREVRGGFLPTVSGSAQYMRNIEPQVIFMPPNIFGPGTGGPLQIGSDNSYNAGLSMSVPLLAPALFRMIQVSDAEIELALERSRASRLNLVSEVKRAFYTLLLAKNSYQVMALSMENARRNLTNIQHLFAQGLVPEYDAIRSEVQVRNLNPAYLQAKNAVSLSAMMLKILLGVDKHVELVALGALADYRRDQAQHHALLSIPLEGNTTLRQLDLQHQTLARQRELLRANRLPTLSAFGNYQYQAQANDFRFSDYHWVTTSMVGLQLQVPIFQGFARKYREQQVLVGMDLLRLQREYTSQSLTLQARNAVTSMMRAAEQITSSRESIALAERGHGIAQTRYRTGTGTLLELNDAEVALTQAKLNYNQALFDYLMATVEYEGVTGAMEGITAAQDKTN